jgi:hypothetical protein
MLTQQLTLLAGVDAAGIVLGVCVPAATGSPAASI